MRRQSGSSIRSQGIAQGACIVVSFALAFIVSGVVRSDEGWGDFMHRLGYRISGPRPVSPHLIHAVVNDASVRTLDLDAQNKNLYARVLATLGNAGIKDIGCDVFFTERSIALEEPMLPGKIPAGSRIHFPVIITSGPPLPIDATDNETWDKFLWHPKILASGSPPKASNLLFPARVLAPVTGGLGHIDCRVDPDGTIRRLPLLYGFADGFWPALSLEILCKYLDVDPSLIEVSFGSYLVIPGSKKNPAIRIPIDESGMMRLSFAGPWNDSFVHFPVHRLLEAENDPDAKVRLYDDLSDALTFLSDSSTRRKDYGTIPLESAYPLSGIHLNAINEMLTNNFPVTPSLPEMLMIIVIACSALWLAIRFFDTYSTVLFTGAGLIVLLFAYFFVRYFTAYVVPLPTMPLAGTAISLITLGVYYYATNRRSMAVLMEKATAALSLELLNRELEDSNKAYVRLQRNLTRILRSITDKLNVPLSRLHEVLAGFMAFEKSMTPQIISEIRTADETTRSLSALVLELTEIAEVKENFDSGDITETDLAESTRGIVRRLAPLAESRGCVLVDDTLGSSIPITANERMLEKMLFLLVHTALKNMSPGNTARVSCSPSPSGIRIEIEGHTESDFDSLFCETRDESPAQGNSLLHDYIALHNGNITLESVSVNLKIVTVAFGAKISDDRKSYAGNEKKQDESFLAKNEDASLPLFPRHPIIIVDHDAKALADYREGLPSAGITNTRLFNNGSDCLRAVGEDRTSVIVLDLALADVSGLALLDKLREEFPEIKVIVVSEIDATETAVECMKKGAFDFAVKPVALVRLSSLIRRAVERTEIESEARRLREDSRSALSSPEAFASIVTCDPAMLNVFRTMEAVASGSEPILILGESGTGKELFAEALHSLSGRSGALVKENIGGLDPGIFSDTLFGHSKGAYTGALAARKGLVEEAMGGTLFLDEIGDLDADMQVKLLRFIESGEYRPVGSDRPRISDARIVAATNADIDALVAAGRFRRDLYYRLSHVIRIPPLRQRTADIVILTEYFLTKATARFQKEEFGVSKRLIGRMNQYPFPGNVRELESLVFAAVKLSENGKEAEAYITQYLVSHAGPESLSPISKSTAFPTLEEAEERLIGEAMRRTGNNQRAAARLLAISPFALNRRLQSRRGRD